MRASSLYTWLTNALFPPTCLACERVISNPTRETALCTSCRGTIEISDALCCGVCHARLAEQKKICHKDQPYTLLAASFYQNPALQKLIWQLKYRKLTVATQELADVMFTAFRNANLMSDNAICVPIPLHPTRQRERGFNQAALLVHLLSAKMNIGMAEVLRRVKKTESQTKMKSDEERKTNMAGCFEITQPELIASKTIFLIDDVATSGATLAEAASVLTTAGARKVIGFVAARAR
jgi:ComF family protein